MPDFVIKTTFKGADKLSPVLKRMGIRVDQVGNKATRSFKRATRQASQFGTVVKGILAAGIVQRAFTVASMAVRELGTEFLEFDKNITKAVTRLPGGLDRTSSAFLEMGKIARREAARTEFSAAQTAGAIEQLALAGFTLEQSMAALPGTINLATNANVAVEEATTIAAKSLGAFGLKVSDTAQLTQNLTRVNDVFSRTVSSATLDITGLFETLKFGGPAAHAAGQSIETFSAITGVLADSAIDASVAGTSMRRAFLNLAAPPKMASKELKKLNITVSKDGKFRDFLAIMKDIETATADMGNTQRLASLSHIFGARAVNAMNAILVRGVDNVVDFRKSLQDAEGASKKMSDTIRKSLTNRLLVLRSAAIEVGFKFIEAFVGDAGGSIDILIRKVQRFDVKPIVNGVKEAIAVFRTLVSVIKPFLDFLPVIIGLWAAYKAIMIAVTLVQAAQFFVQLAGAIKTATVAQGLLNVVMAANPVGLVALAIVGLIATIAILIAKWDDVNAAWSSAFGDIHIGLIQHKVAYLKIFQDLINGIIDLVTALPLGILKFLGVDLDKHIPKVEFDFSDELSQIKQIRRLQKDIAEETAGHGVGRGVAGIRGGIARRPITPEETVAKMQQAAGQTFTVGEKERRAGLEQRIAGAAAQELFAQLPQLQAPNVGEADARVFFEGRISFENAPEGTTLETKTTGASPVKTEGLGQQ